MHIHVHAQCMSISAYAARSKSWHKFGSDILSDIFFGTSGTLGLLLLSNITKTIRMLSQRVCYPMASLYGICHILKLATSYA